MWIQGEKQMVSKMQKTKLSCIFLTLKFFLSTFSNLALCTCIFIHRLHVHQDLHFLNEILRTKKFTSLILTILIIIRFHCYLTEVAPQTKTSNMKCISNLRISYVAAHWNTYGIIMHPIDVNSFKSSTSGNVLTLGSLF